MRHAPRTTSDLCRPLRAESVHVHGLWQVVSSGPLRIFNLNLNLKKATTYQRKTKAACFETVPSDL